MPNLIWEFRFFIFVLFFSLLEACLKEDLQEDVEGFCRCSKDRPADGWDSSFFVAFSE